MHDCLVLVCLVTWNFRTLLFNRFMQLKCTLVSFLKLWVMCPLPRIFSVIELLNDMTSSVESSTILNFEEIAF
jgi:hypothetical protein